ncbi:carcinoembryonic antigen-related cell adhesion molecule 5-like [Megalops cyprinoides]|uniref:carcinoembryonic antigen-related cell adhesion molecule 5-like n=1 Tax=Megalops cyprinoides TaxID=118141 RepID=UPI0018650495|nr:carcinoembryonic antigen-related cell adhesion molecule 5-like [Megalops cyprinoides]
MTVAPQKEFHISGSNLTLSCSAQSSPPAQFQWAFNGGMLNREGQELRLENIQANQSGSYTCWAHNIRTLRYKSSDPSLITVLERISGATITGPTAPLIAGNSSANLSCQATAGTISSRQWLKDGQPLSPSNSITISGDNSSVSIDPVEGSDNGEYQCRLSNPVSTDTASYNLIVNYGPQDVVIQGEREVEVGQRVELKCSALSIPPATFTWTVNGTETDVRTAEYTIEKATHGNSGDYICVASNAVTGSTQASPVHVLAVNVPVQGLSTGAIVGIVIGVLVCVAVVAAIVIITIKKKKSSSPTSGSTGNTTSPYANGGEPELAYADISHFKKSDGGKVQVGNAATEYAEVTVGSRPGRPPSSTQETSYAEIRKN